MMTRYSMLRNMLQEAHPSLYLLVLLRVVENLKARASPRRIPRCQWRGLRLNDELELVAPARDRDGQSLSR
jgi:hypothetical protein